jgi:glycosidase
LQTNQQPYQWQNTSFQRPANEDLVIYELLVRDFVGTHSYKTLSDTLTYLKKLGVNAIELMPIMEFSGNESWGYNPIYYFAPDKYYGTKNDLKAFIDKAHQMGMAVILDMVLNQADYEFPYVKAYWDGSKPAANSPYFNQQATHPFSVFFDFNHESAATRALVDTVNTYWLREYKFDGFRFDLSKGFTQKNSGNDVGAWSAKDDSRIAIWKRIYDKIRTVDNTAYVILEHLGANDEEKILADYGMMLWGNMQPNYKEAALGFDNNKADLNWTSYKQRNWTMPHAIAYMESHDEERLMVEQQLYGRVNPATNYNTKTLPTALDRMKLASAFYFTIPGPKMIWQFGELGYDLSINRCPDGTISENCRVANKPPKWEYYTDANRLKLFKVYAELIKLKTTQAAFKSTDFTVNTSSRVKRIAINHSSMQVNIIGNFGIDTISVNASFQNTGKWYDYFSGDSILVGSTSETIILQPGEFHIFSTSKLIKPEAGLLPDWKYTLKSTAPTAVEDELLNSQTTIYPNPTAGKIALKMDNEISSSVELRLNDLRGRNIYSVRINKYHRLLKHEMNFERLPHGIYILEIVTGNKKAIKRIYKN